MTHLGIWLIVAATAACPGPSTSSTTPPPPPPAADAAPPAPPPPITISIVGTNDLHGHVLGDEDKNGLPLFATYLALLREARAKDGGGVLLVDAGDAFQGTLESNMNEGKAVIEAYNLLGYHAMAIGNHEFDYGPEGDRATPRSAEDDPRGALKARAAEARFPLLAANLIDDATGKPVDWPNVKPRAIVEVAGVKIGLIGVSTWDTPRVTMAANIKGLSMAPLPQTIAEEAKSLRAQGAVAVVAIAHAGGKCDTFDDPDDLSSCDPKQEIVYVANNLPPGAVDAIVAGHTHQAIAHVVNGIPIIESWRYGHAFGRIELTIDRAAGKVVEAKPLRYEVICADCTFLGVKVKPDPKMAALLAPWLEKAAERRGQRLGPTIAETFTHARPVESAVGNLFVDLMREARKTDVALTNGGGLRQDLPAGEITYGQLYEAWPFDNLFATTTITGKQLREIVLRNLQTPGGIFSLSGVRVKAACVKGQLAVEIFRDSPNPKKRKPIRDTDKLTLATSDFLATGGDGAFSDLPAGSVVVDEEAPPIREALAELLRGKKGTLDPDDYLDAKSPRLAYPGPRPVKCEAAAAPAGR
jgi:5'-nucleotidase